MRTMRLKGTAAALALVLLLVPTSVYAINYGDIPASRISPAGWTDITWNDPYPGQWTTLNVTQHGLPANDNTVNASSVIKQIIDNHPGQKLILYFPAGVYYFYSDLQITSGNVRLKGAGMTQTEFRISIPAANVGGIGFVGPGFTGGAVKVTNSPWEGATYVFVEDASSFNPGDFVQLYLENGPKGGSDYFYGQIFKISWIDYNAKKIVFTQKLGLNFPASGVPKLRKINMIENVGISDVRIKRVRDNADYSKNVYMKFVNNGYVTDIDSWFTANEHISFIYSRNVVAERNKVHESYEYGGGGHGYGIVVNYCTTNAKIVNNKLWKLRHHVLLQKGANHVVVAYNSMEEPMGSPIGLSIHGHYPHNNLFESNMLKDGIIDYVWGENGPRNTFYRNMSTGVIGISDYQGQVNTTPKTNIIGNVMADLWYHAQYDPFIGANRKNGTVIWGQLPTNPTLPPSLYLESKPGFLGSKPWPLFGPGVSNWGESNTLPAYDRPK